MNRAALALALCLGLGGCLHSPDSAAPGQRVTLADNTQDFDRYVEQRTTSLLAMGATRDPAEAWGQATLNAARRHGPRAAEVASAMSVPVSGSRRAAPLDSAALDRAAKAR